MSDTGPAELDDHDRSTDEVSIGRCGRTVADRNGTGRRTRHPGALPSVVRRLTPRDRSGQVLYRIGTEPEHPPVMDTHKARKAVKVGRLARSEELDASNHDAAISQGATAGRLAAEAGLTLGELDVQVGSFCGAAGAWGAAVDAWYDAQPRDVTATEYASLGSAYCALSSEALGIVERMWAELQRHRSV